MLKDSYSLQTYHCVRTAVKTTHLKIELQEKEHKMLFQIFSYPRHGDPKKIKSKSTRLYFSRHFASQSMECYFNSKPKSAVSTKVSSSQKCLVAFKLISQEGIQNHRIKENIFTYTVHENKMYINCKIFPEDLF